ncbi:hypothetical protein FACS1894156_8610 [Bacteroidia bacterium]|nr:hypothetical protein FACS1894156_8610 [Bacteroidia bacterium]
MGNSCTQVDKTLGSDMLPPSQQQKVQIELHSEFVSLLSTVLMDSLSTNNFTTAALGRIEDDRFGKSRAGFAAQFQPLSYNFTADSIVYDSAFLILTFTGKMGTDNTPMNLQIYELLDSLSDTITYYGASRAGNNIIDALITNAPINEPYSFTGDSTSVMIPLKQDFVQKLESTIKMTTKSEFVQVLKGLYVAVEDGAGGCIKYCDPVISSTSTTIPNALWAYYHRPVTEDSVVNAVVPYIISTADPRFGVFEHTYKAAEDVGSDRLYLQGLNGVGTRVDFDTAAIRAWKGEKTINRVELLIPIAAPENSNPLLLDIFPTPLTGIYRKNNNFYACRDAVISMFGGAIDRSQMQYSFNITHFFTDVYKGNVTSLYIVPSSTSSAASFGVLDKTPQLKITYGTINDE